ncbi:MAG: acetate--CoA ligase [Bacteroidales bacterium]|nr:acetate--CoA ligase [Bacteroidales bacterium]
MNDLNASENKVTNLDWAKAETELNYRPGDLLNIGWYCSDRVCHAGLGSKTALIWKDSHGLKRAFTFNDIRLFSNTLGDFIRHSGVENGDRVCLFLDRIPELYISFLGILKIGAVVQPLFSAFGEESLFVRLENAQTKAIITQKKHLSKIRRIRHRLPQLRLVIIVDSLISGEPVPGEVLFDLEKETPVDPLDIFPTRAESPSVLHYTSGTTGQPKGVQHVHYSLISQYYTAKYVLDLKADDIYWCTADPGWVTGTSYGIIGPWSLGITQCVLDSGFSASSWYKFIADNKVTVWYTAPTAIRSLMKAEADVVKDFDLSSLRHLASVGEPLNAEAVIWSQKVFGKPFHDTFWQTETGSIMIANMPRMKIKPGSMGKPFTGLTAAVLDQQRFEPLTKAGQVGLIAFKPDWPALMRGYWNNISKFREKFINGWYITGDRASIDGEGYYWFIGRDDDVINTGGHLVSPFEVESALLEHPAIAESAVTSKPDEINMEVVKAFISLKPGNLPDKDLELEIMNFIRKRLSSIAMPQEIEFVDRLPKTRSGKIMRRLLRAQEWGEPIGDTSTLEDE